MPKSPPRPTAKPPRRDATSRSSSGPRRVATSSVRIVGLGASAGGLDAFEKFLRAVPADSGLAYVVVQHLDPTRRGVLAELLQRATVMPVTEIVDRGRVAPDHVYVIPPNRELAVVRGVLHLLEPTARRGHRLPIDAFLASLAADAGNRAIGVVLSGMGADGTLGLTEIRRRGGLALVQDPTTAAFDGMPRSAIDAAVADVVAAPEALPARIVAWLRRPRAAEPETAAEPPSLGAFERVLVLLRARCGHDFSGYKPSTLRRRIERRMAVHRLGGVAAYARYLHANPEELDLLFKELLIGVTSFFRDPAAWDQLGAEILPALLAARPAGRPFRAWVPACATGEEAYTLAMVLREALEAARPPRPPAVQIFATDLDRDGIDRARLGRFPATIAADVSPARLARYFVESDRGYQVTRAIREMVVFAPHDVLQDPPFTRLDLVCCRNLLIYLTPELQRTVLPVFHYALHSGGHLLLGSAETVGEAQGLFAAVPGAGRFYRRVDVARAAGSAATPPPLLAPVDDVPPTPVRSAERLQSVVDQLLLARYAPAAVLANRAGDIVYVHGRTGTFLEPAAGKANWNLLAMAREGLRAELGTAFQRAVRTDRPVTAKGLALRGEPGRRRVDLSVEPLGGAEVVRGLVLVVFAEVAPRSVASGAATARTAGGSRATTARELAAVTEELRVLRAEAQASQAEARATGEELQSANEELQSTNEELMTSKEEMQSMNEELQTLNHELQAKVDDLSSVNNDLKNLLDSSEVAILFLDAALCVRRFTAGSSRVFRLIPGDVGRPITDIASGLQSPSFADDARSVLRSLTPHEREVAGRDGRWFNVRIVPYRTLENVIDGVSVTFTDITERRRLEAALAGARAGLPPAEGGPP